MSCASCSAKAALRNSYPIGRKNNSIKNKLSLSKEQTCFYTKEQLELKLDELLKLKELVTKRIERLVLSSNIWLLKQSIKKYDNNCNQYKTKLDGLFKK